MHTDIEKVVINGKLFALILRKKLASNRTEFYTSKESSLQLGIIVHERGYVEKPHIHKHKAKIIEDTQETLHVEEGMVKVKFYEDDGSKVSEVLLKEGDVILLVGGGHAIEVLEDLKGMKVKQGPYVSAEEDKIFLEVKE